MRFLIVFLVVMEVGGGGVEFKIIGEVEWVGFVDLLYVGGEESVKVKMIKVFIRYLGVYIKIAYLYSLWVFEKFNDFEFC